MNRSTRNAMQKANNPGTQKAAVADAFGIVNKDNRVFFIAHDYLRSRLSADGLREAVGGYRAVTSDGAAVASLIRHVYLDCLQSDSKAEAKNLRARAKVIELALKVLGVEKIPAAEYVVDRMTHGELLAIDPHFRSLVRGVGGDLDVIRPVTALMQLVIDLRVRARHLQYLRNDRKLFFYLAKRFAEAGMKPPLKAHVIPIYEVLDDAMRKANPGGEGLSRWPYRDYKKVREALAAGSKAAAI